MQSVGAVYISPGDYDIGSDDIPNSGPRHVRRLIDGFWIDRNPISLQHFEYFTIQNGFIEPDLWNDGGWLRSATCVRSVDERCHQVRRSSMLAQSASTHKTLNALTPVTGLNWFEAGAVCRQFTARLPFEIEWEIAMQALSSDATYDRLEEWTLDTFSPQFWRADFAKRGVPWSESQLPVTVRGNGPTDIIRHVAVRRGRSPDSTSHFCGFRRVWDQEPPANAFVGDR